MKVSKNCIELIKKFEGFSSTPYKCPAGVWTIGYGSTRYPAGDFIASTDLPITEEQAETIMRLNLINYENDVIRYVSQKINQSQFDALVDFAYNCGSKNLLKSTLLKKVNKGDFLGASKEFGKWVYADGKKLSGLVKRREAERILFCQMT